MYYGLRGQSLNVALSVVAGMGFLLFGYDQGVMSALLTLPAFSEVFPSIDTIDLQNQYTPSELDYHSTLQGTTIALYEIGCMMGALTCLWLGDKIGRRKTIFGGACVMTVGAVIQASSFSLAQLIVGRIVTGIGNGFITATVPMWQSECSKAHRRGALVMIEGSLIACGIMISYWIDFGFYFVDGQASWRAPVALQIIFSLFLIAFVLPMPESPRWLIKVGRVDDARVVLGALENVNPDNPAVSTSIQEIRDTLSVESNWSFRELFRNGKNRNFHRAALGIGAQFMQQICGINLITYYAATLFEQNLLLSPKLSRVLSGANGTEYFIASFIAIFTVEGLGRRKLMLFGAAGQAATMAALAGSASVVETNRSAAVGAAVLLFVFNSFFAVGFLGMTWLYPAEIVSLEIRAPANALSTASNWITNFLVVMITPPAFQNIAYKTYVIFAVINAAMVPAIYFFYPETSKRSLEEMDFIFRKVSGPMAVFDVVKVADKEPRSHLRDQEDEKKKNMTVNVSEGENTSEANSNKA